MSKGILILSGYNMRAIVAFCRWAQDQHVPFHLIARNEFDPISLTDFSDRVFLIRKHENLELEDFCIWISRIREKYSYQKVLVLPSTEFLNRFMVNNQNAIELVDGVVPLVNKVLYERISDKYSFGKLCLDFGIPVPEEYNKIPKTFPFVAKPRSYASIFKRQLKPYLIHYEADLADFRQNESLDDFYFQQYIEGKSLYLLASMPRNEKPVLFAQENLMQQANGGSIVLARIDDFHKQRAVVQYLELLAEINFYGLLMIEIRFHKGTQKYFMIEANPRLWGPIQLAVDNGIDFFGSFLRDYKFNVSHFSSQDRHAQFYYWSGGLTENSKIVYHNYSKDQFIDEFNSINRCNLFYRKDTMRLFRHELVQS
jgi:predicted ATP-grasp superfamily ATP-dependent carboligase